MIISGITSFVSEMPGQASELYSNSMYNRIEELCQIPKYKENNAENLTIDLDDEIANEAVVIQNDKIRWIPYSERVKKAAEKQSESKTEKTSKPSKPEEKKHSQPQDTKALDVLAQKLIDQNEDDKKVEKNS